MTPSETIRLQALKLKANNDGSHPSLIDSALENSVNKEEVKKEYRNVCALIHIGQFESLERLCNVLDLSKREVMTMALNEFLITANAIIDEVNPFENVEEIQAIWDNQ